MLASLRTLLLMALALAPRVLQIDEAYGRSAILLMAVAGIYNIFTIVASVYPARFRLRRALIVAMDATLISAWIHISGRWDLIPFYYVVVVVAAMWYRVLGGVIVAAVCNFLWLFLWARLWATSVNGRPPMLAASMALNSVLLFVIGALAGYIAEAQDREREKSLERELLIANYQQEIDLSGELQPLLLSRLERGGALGDLDIGAALQSARVAGGGDYLDAIPLPDGTTLLCIADVAGKSIRAQARVPLLKYSLRALAPLHRQPAELMARLQTTLLPDLGPELYIAVCLVVVDAEAQSLTWCNAGHLAPLLVRAAPGKARRDNAKSDKRQKRQRQNRCGLSGRRAGRIGGDGSGAGLVSRNENRPEKRALEARRRVVDVHRRLARRALFRRRNRRRSPGQKTGAQPARKVRRNRTSGANGGGSRARVGRIGGRGSGR